MAEKIVNGLDVQAVMDTVKAVEGNPEIADFRFRLTNRWESGGYNRGTVGKFYGALQENVHNDRFVMPADEPTLLAGTDKGPNAIEYLLQALAACITGTLVYHSAIRGIEIRSMESEYEADIDLRGFLGMSEEVNKAPRRVRVMVRVDTDEENIEKLKEFSGLSPVYNAIRDSMDVEISIKRMAAGKKKAA